ncbi:MAG: ACT domain-containing protein [Clostridia bacterium]
MNDNYLIVDKRILPDYYEKVLMASDMLRDGRAHDVSEAARLCGISRSTYYKYKDYIFRTVDDVGRKAIVALMLSHEKGVLGEVLSELSLQGANILTITQSLPIHGKANVVISLDMSHLMLTIDELLPRLAMLRGASGVKLLSIE